MEARTCHRNGSKGIRIYSVGPFPKAADLKITALLMEIALKEQKLTKRHNESHSSLE